MRYFSHDTNASQDELIMQLRLEHGGAAVDAYWTILEFLHGEEKPLPFGENQRETKSVSHRLCLGFEKLQEYVKTMVEIGLLISRKSPSNDCEFISSLRANEQIEAYRAKAENARKNGNKGGRPKKPKGNLEKTQSVSSSVSEKNQSENLTKTKGIGLDKLNQIPTVDGAGGKNPAPPTDKAAADMKKIREEQATLEANAVPCPIDYRAIFDEVDKAVV